MSVLTSVEDYYRAIRRNAEVVKLVGFLDRYLENPAQFKLSELKGILDLVEDCKKTIPELRALLNEIGEDTPSVDLDPLIDDIKAHIDFLSPKA